MMKWFRVRLYGGLLLSAIAMLILAQTSFAGNKVEVVYDDGTYGLARIKMSAKEKAQVRKELRSEALIAAPKPKIQMYSAFTSDKVPSEHSSEDITYFAWLDKNNAYLIGAFTVTGGTSLVKVHWLVDNDEKSNTIFDDPEEPDGTALSPYYWYFAWYKADAGDFTGPSKLHDLTVKVGIWNGSTETNQKSDDCKFKVVN
ncbi:MAG: hypothetical protein FJY07_13225, partial [Bacteroidetes bacterium]|nr:hypothetical protein [Bacteroidota bacterium]